ncbi:hypothetical protein X769_18385 [Mesorhizobium sp. LSJC268A00]|uniref:hypothetical protein n=1 Tax=unclassified Mesorhizobium TaxID=325217 RepID=UPI0003CE56E7|nr:hypothetical protein [Mesorhizobium sp. LSJC268A00]ESX03427.1 hypothetical protein X769_18385 [Mesorhizobium sp. LSJC268A00]
MLNHIELAVTFALVAMVFLPIVVGRRLYPYGPMLLGVMGTVLAVVWFAIQVAKLFL